MNQHNPIDEAGIGHFVAQLQDAGQFADERTAVASRTQALLTASRRGRFDTWLMLVLGALAEQSVPLRDAKSGTAVLCSATAVHNLEQWRDEQGMGFVRRLTLRARMVDEPWLCVALADRSGVMWWYAEARGHGVAAARVGRLGGDGDRDAFTGEPIHPSESHALGQILRGHPARRRFPLRSG